MGINFGKTAAVVAKVPTVADAVAQNVAFQTSYGTIYHKSTTGEFIKFGNPSRSSRNFLAVKSSTYFDGRQGEAVTLLGDLNVAL